MNALLILMAVLCVAVIVCEAMAQYEDLRGPQPRTRGTLRLVRPESDEEGDESA